MSSACILKTAESMHIGITISSASTSPSHSQARLPKRAKSNTCRLRLRSEPRPHRNLLTAFHTLKPVKVFIQTIGQKACVAGTPRRALLDSMICRRLFSEGPKTPNFEFLNQHAEAFALWEKDRSRHEPMMQPPSSRSGETIGAILASLGPRSPYG